MTPPRAGLADLDRLSPRLGGALRAFAAARRDHGLTGEEMLIFLAAGHLGLDAHGAVTRLVPRTHAEIAAFTGIPRETVRRKIGRLCDRGLTEATPRGVVVCDVDGWSRIAEDLVAGLGTPHAVRGPTEARPVASTTNS